MKTTNKLLIYDDHCPMCVWYTGLFVKYGLLRPEHRIAFSHAPEHILAKLDFEKAKDEIPLVDEENNNVYYGFDALLDILGQRVPLIEKVGSMTPVNWIMKKIYKLISFNRKVVVAVKCGKGEIDCSPAFNVFYRLLLILISVSIGFALLTSLHERVLIHLPFYGLSYQQLAVACMLLLGINYIAAFALPDRKSLEYLGQHAMLSLLFVLLMVPLIIAANYTALSSITILLYGIPVSLFIIREYVRRMRFVEKYSKQRFTLLINNLSLFLFASYVFNIL